MRILENLQPERVFYNFEELSRIPRCSGNEKKVSDYLVDFAKKYNLDVIQDEALNIIIKKPGTAGYENAPTVVLQGHIDMVCEKRSDVEHNFCLDPIALRVEGDYVMATGTTLGADNGIAAAMCMAILESKDIPHPPLEVLLTTSEETGMDGAIALDPKNIEGKILINIDSEEEGKALVSCAGGERDEIEIPIKWEAFDESFIPCSISFKGLKGGHSGMEINEGRANANVLMGRVLAELNNNIEFRLVSVDGGSKTNAIPREAKAVVVVSSKDEEKFKEVVREMENAFKNEYKSADPDLVVEIEKDKAVEKVFSNDTTDKMIAALMLIPNGVQTMSKEMEGLVESSNNLGIVTTLDDSVSFKSSIRSSVRSLKEKMANQMELIAKITGGKWNAYAAYPEWEYSPNSYIRDLFQKVYKEMTGEELEIAAIHAGLECGLFKEKFGEMDMVSFGPNMYAVHTPDEKLSISSTKRTWELLLNVLKEIK
ncbi:aminoacyl-histidine dipeptidase [Anaerosalibacter sp. Marseille-P3206]|uniref:aminoacyl-histidine dipeptidase n=1 Tax=Anaerosalibacter sp. Marseille-P3206 TaxID=1871005 RepID=UPI0009847D32|nr:aminoacyl-histidine dipeptidase [Anaerosalibacter sp. Marseille-P3206]